MTDEPDRVSLRRTIVKASVGVATFLMIGGLGVAWTMYQGATQAQRNATILSCDNLIAFEARRADSHWLDCLAWGGDPWGCRYSPTR